MIRGRIAMSDGSIDLRADARAKAYSIPLEDYHVADPALFQADAMWPYFERLRNEDPVHYSKGDEETGPYWSITRYNDIMTVDTTHQVFSSDAHLGGITIRNFDEDFVLPMFIAMDPPKHDIQRKTVSPIVSPQNLAKLEASSASGSADPGRPADRRALRLGRQGLDRADHPDAGHPVRLPLGRAPQADPLVRRRHRLAGKRHRRERGARRAELLECLGYFTNLWNERVNADRARQRPDLDAGPRRGDPEHAAHGVSGQHHPADRRRQRHHPQLDDRRPLRPVEEPARRKPSCAPIPA
jgi:hypothetical protein